MSKLDYLQIKEVQAYKTYFEVEKNYTEATTMNSMFFDCTSLVSLDLNSFDTSRVTNTNTMFLNCSNLASIDLRNVYFSSVSFGSLMFEKVTAKIIVKDEVAKLFIESADSRGYAGTIEIA